MKRLKAKRNDRDARACMCRLPARMTRSGVAGTVEKSNESKSVENCLPERCSCTVVDKKTEEKSFFCSHNFCIMQFTRSFVQLNKKSKSHKVKDVKLHIALLLSHTVASLLTKQEHP